MLCNKPFVIESLKLLVLDCENSYRKKSKLMQPFQFYISRKSMKLRRSFYKYEMRMLDRLFIRIYNYFVFIILTIVLILVVEEVIESVNDSFWRNLLKNNFILLGNDNGNCTSEASPNKTVSIILWCIEAIFVLLLNKKNFNLFLPLHKWLKHKNDTIVVFSFEMEARCLSNERESCFVTTKNI